jgi:uncharacterized membrane protein YgdD (TMEM256/DUF423 family)
MPIPFWTIGCIYGASSVTLGAFGAHGLKKRIADPARIANWNTAAHYQVPLFPSSTAMLEETTNTTLTARPLRRTPPSQLRRTQEHPRS